MRRREFIRLFSSTVVAWPLTARAQQAATPVIGFLSAGTFENMRDYVAAFHRALADGGFAEGRNVAIEYRWSEGHNDRFPAMAEDLVRHQVAVIVAASTPASLAAKAATQTIPIVFAVGTDPVAIGASLSMCNVKQQQLRFQRHYISSPRQEITNRNCRNAGDIIRHRRTAPQDALGT